MQVRHCRDQRKPKFKRQESLVLNSAFVVGYPIGSRERTALAILVIALICAFGCDQRPADAKKRIEPVYDRETGKLQLLKYDSNGNGKVDTWSYMDGARVVRIEIDNDEDGKIDRWEYYGPDQKLEKIGSSRAKNGKPDAWSYIGADGSLARLDISTQGNGKANRTEYYEHSALVRAEEDNDGDGKIDKWETFDGDHLSIVAFDTTRRGFPDKRLVYGPKGTARVELDRIGNGTFVAATDPQPARAPR
jgi:hypothetical protein